MKKCIHHIPIYFFFAIFLLLVSSCKKDFTNPSAVPIDQAFTTAQSLTGDAIGLQRVYTVGRGSSLYNRISLDALLTNQLFVLNQGNTSEYQLQQRGSVDGTNTILGGLWTSSNKIIFDANNVIRSAEKMSDKNYASGLIGYATIFKALALGDMAMYWEKIPDTVGQQVNFVGRMQGYAKAISAIDRALAYIKADSISKLFLTAIPQNSSSSTPNPTIDIVNTLHALKARYSLFSLDYPTALTEANAVALSSKSAFTFTTSTLNPIFETATSTNNVYAPGDSSGVNQNMGLPLGLRPDGGDKRVPFYISTNATSPVYRIAGFGAGSTTPWPLYLPSEMTLIKSEVYARQNDLVNALAELNKVVTKQAAADPFGVGADLPPVSATTQQQVLDLIYKHRSIELYIAGLRLEDMRRFGRPMAERKRNLLPYPFIEKDNNPNTPPDPTF